ncbi:MAG: NUDIX hydrolase [Gammaproteobacteria bacterium]
MKRKPLPTSRKSIFRGTVVDLGIESVELPNGQRLEMEIVRHPGGAAVVAVDSRQQVCLLHQYRHAAGGWLWELPAGKLDPGETPQQTAARELAEEAGLKGGSWRSLGNIISSPAICDEVIHLFLVTELLKVPIQHESTEVIEIHWVEFTTALAWIRKGKIRDAKTVTGLMLAAEHLRNF